MRKKIPDNAKIVFQGFMFDVYNWQQEMFDGSFAVFEAIKKRDTSAVLAVTGDKIIINYEEQPYKDAFIGLPGGLHEKNESPLENTQRELLEETGYISNNWEEWFISEPIENQKIDWKNYFYIARNCKKVSEQKLDGGEKIEIQLISFEEFLELRNNIKFKSKDLIPLLEEISKDEVKKEAFKKLLFTTN